MKKLNYSILSAGNIAEKMAKTVSRMSEVQPYAIAARSLDRAQALAEKYGFQKAYGSYEELVNDENVDLIYVASPHSHHYKHAKLCLLHDKNVLCEKAFTVNAKQGKELIELAKSRNLFIMEAVWTRFQPFAKKLHELLESDVIGEPLTLTASFGQKLTHIERLVSPDLAGGALLDLGIYTINFASMFFGTDIEKMVSAAVKTDKGVDAQNSITLVYKNGRMAVLNSSFYSAMRNNAVIYGTSGRIEIDKFWNAQEIRVYNGNDPEPKVYSLPFDFTGYEYEVRAAAKAMEQGRLECTEMPHEETLRILKMMDDLREAWGVRYSCE